MKQTKHTIGSIFALSVIIFLFVQCKEQTTKELGEANAGAEVNLEYLPLAYVELDSLSTHFEFYNRLVSDFEDKIVKQQNTLTSGYKKLENEIINYQQKAQANAFLTTERAQQEQNRIQRMKDDLDRKAAQMEQEMALENRLLMQQISDTLVLGIKEFNTPQKYHMIFAKSDNNILYADTRYNITNEIIEFLNKRFKVK